MDASTTAVKRRFRRAAKESAVETELRRRVHAIGGECVKVADLGRRGFPDRLLLLPGGIVAFVELKRPRGGILSVHQQQYRMRFAELGLVIELVKDEAEIDSLLRRIVSVNVK